MTDSEPDPTDRDGPPLPSVVAVLVDVDETPLGLETITQFLTSLGSDARLVVATTAQRARRLHQQSDLSVHVIPQETMLEGARNQVVRAAPEPYAFFIDPNAALPPRLLARPIEILDQQPHVSAIALGIISRPLPRITLTALAGSPRVLGPGNPEVLFAASEAMVVRTEHFRAIGGFDERLTDGGSDIDLGWRLWIYGGSVRSCATSTLDLPDRPQPSAPDASDLSWSRLRNSLATLFKCYDDERLPFALQAAVLMAPSLASPEGCARALDEFRRWLPDLRNDRRTVQTGRLRNDGEILHRFGQPLEALLEMGPEAEEVSQGLNLADLFGTRHRILVVTGDVLTERMAGPAIRAWHICEALAADHDVRLATTTSICQVASKRFGTEAVDNERMQELEQWCDVVVLQGFVLLHSPVLRQTRKIMLVDLYDPIHLETLELSKLNNETSRALQVRQAVDVLNDQLLRGDFFVCASQKQRDFWLGQLSALGRVNPSTYDDDPMLYKLIDVVPFGLPDDDPIRQRRAIKGVIPGIAADDEVVLWGGGIYDWFDPLVLIRAIDKLRRRRPKVRLLFMGVRHPNPEVPEMRMSVAARALSDHLGLTGIHVFFNEGWVGYQDRQNYLLDSNLGVSTHFRHAESAFSFRTRILDYLWAGLPIVATEGDGFADLIEAEGLGLVVPPEDVDSLEAALFRLLDDPEYAAACRKNVTEVRRRYTWSSVLRPLTDFCRDPRHAPDLAQLPGVPPEAVEPAAPDGPNSGPRAWSARGRRALQVYEEGGLLAFGRLIGQRLERSGRVGRVCTSLARRLIRNRRPA